MRRGLLIVLALGLLPLLALTCMAASPARAGSPPAAPARQPRPRAEIFAPQAAGLGEPFLLRVRAPRPLAGLSVTWLQRTARLTGRTLPGGWEAVALLGSDVGNTALGRHELVLRHGRKGQVVVRRTNIDVLPVARPVESLELDAAMVVPPKEAYARILAERKLLRKLLLATLSRAVPAGTDARRWSLPLARPVPGEVSSIYGIGRILNGQPHAPHRGLDLEADTGQPVLAAADGVVLFSGELYYAGNAVYLDHGQGLVTSYFHLSERHVQTGARVARGQALGLAGDTGRSTRSHLHFGVWALGRHVDPEPLFLYESLP